MEWRRLTLEKSMIESQMSLEAWDALLQAHPTPEALPSLPMRQLLRALAWELVSAFRDADSLCAAFNQRTLNELSAELATCLGIDGARILDG